MNKYTYEEIEVGNTESFNIKVTEKMLQNFAEFSSDYNPLHTSKAFANNAGYRDKVAYGMLTASFISTLVGVYLPGENSLIHKVEVEFPAPVYVGDELAFTGEVTRKEDRFHVIELKVFARNCKGEKVLRGKIRVGCLK